MMQQINQPAIFKRNSLINKAIDYLTRDVRPVSAQFFLLHPQPVAQRQLFLTRAIKDHLRVTFQLMPKTTDGTPVNIRGHVKPLDKSRYLITCHNTFYVVYFDQIRYIANL